VLVSGGNNEGELPKESAGKTVEMTGKGKGMNISPSDNSEHPQSTTCLATIEFRWTGIRIYEGDGGGKRSRRDD